MATTTTHGPRATKLEEVLDRAVHQTMRACAYEKLETCFPTLARTDGETLRHAGEQVTAFMTDSCRAEFAKILKDRAVPERLDELDRIIGDARARKESGEPAFEDPSEMSPEAVLRAHLLPLKRQELADLHVKLAQLQAHNADALEALDVAKRATDEKANTLRQSLQNLDKVRIISASPDNSFVRMKSMTDSDTGR